MKILTKERIKEVFDSKELDKYPYMATLKALLQAQLDQDRAEHVCDLEQLASAYDSMIDNMGMGKSNFKQSDWNYTETLLEALKKEGR